MLAPGPRSCREVWGKWWWGTGTRQEMRRESLMSEGTDYATVKNRKGTKDFLRRQKPGELAGGR